MARCRANMRIWCHLLSSLHEEEVAAGGSVASPARGMPEDSCHLFACLSEAVAWIQQQQQQTAAKQSTLPCHIQVLATGSLHLIGGIMSLVDPDLALA